MGKLASTTKTIALHQESDRLQSLTSAKSQESITINIYNVLCKISI
ncbi:MAG: hypothetical protein F6K30_05545 [Cyanothece sp. SIO2G6]|nr:hypothetical protein [Cyanothece sp. SIO2G6]